MEETWKGVIYQGIDYSNRIEVSNNGKLRNSITKYEYTLRIGKTGYYYVIVSLGSRKNRKAFKIHKAVAETFIPNVNNYPCINHKDGNKLNNRVDNLEWCTQKYNVLHAYRIGTHKAISGTNNKNAKLTLEDLKYIRENYKAGDKNFGCRALAKKFNIAHQTISCAIRYKTYKDISC